MLSLPIHMVFDFIAVTTALLLGLLAYQYLFKNKLPQTIKQLDARYFVWFSAGTILGSYILGSLNLIISDHIMIGRSILGALMGATIAVECYKHKKHIQDSTGYIYVIPFTVLVITGRIGCLLSGLHDQTHGSPTYMNWGWDYGDHILRHPVQLYESLAMTIFLVFFIILSRIKPVITVRYGYYICVLFYCSQRFIGEFFKPYSKLLLSFNLFHIACLCMIIYGICMIIQERKRYGSA